MLHNCDRLIRPGTDGSTLCIDYPAPDKKSQPTWVTDCALWPTATLAGLQFPAVGLVLQFSPPGTEPFLRWRAHDPHRSPWRSAGCALETGGDVRWSPAGVPHISENVGSTTYRRHKIKLVGPRYEEVSATVDRISLGSATSGQRHASVPGIVRGSTGGRGR